MRLLRQAALSSPDARLAIGMFCYSVRKQAAAMIAALGGVDRMVFTGGIGEYDAEARDEICQGLLWIDVRVSVMSSKENEQIARHARDMIVNLGN
jgi:acetate kinase